MNQTVLGFFRKEFSQALRDPRMRMILFVVPIIQMTLFGTAISTEVRNITLAMVAKPSDHMAHKLYEHALASGWFKPAKTSVSDPFHMVQNGEAEVVLVAGDETLTQGSQRTRGNMQLLVNSVNAVRARAIDGYMSVILSRLAQDQGERLQDVQPVKMEVRTLFNPTLETSIFMVPGVMGMLICMVTLILTSMAVARERETGTFETLASAPIRPWELMLGKTVPFFVIGMSNVPLILMIGMLLFDVPLRGAFWQVGLASAVFVVCTVSIGVLLSSIAQTQQQAMLGTFLFLFPAILLSGLMFPIENMPSWMKVLAYCDPLSHFMVVLRNILLKGGDLTVLATRIGALAGIASITSFFAYRRFKAILS